MNDTKKIEWVSLIANLAILVGLVVLIIELSAANKLAETQAVALQLDQMQQAQLWFAETSDMPEIELKVISDGVQSLSPVERSKFRRWNRSRMLLMQSHYYHYEQGYLDDESGQEVLAVAARLMVTWEELGLEIGDKNFRDAVEAAASE
jgi:hypothetical protein